MTGASSTTLAREWVIALEPWIVQDGNYGEFAVGETHEFALEFFAYDISIAEPRPPAAIHVGRTRYQVQAPVVWVDGKLWMIDAGVLAYCDTGSPPGLRMGAWVSGEISLSIDCFSYFESYANDPRVPPLIYTWRITGIRELTAPAPPPNVYVPPDEMEWASRDVQRTDAGSDRGDPVLTYELVCERLDVEPKRQLVIR